MSVATFGSLNVDIIYSGIDRLPNPGEEIYYPNFDIQLGGGSVLIPIVMSHFGIESKLGTYLSNDFQSTIAKGLLDKLEFKNYHNFYTKKDRSSVIVSSAISLKSDRCFVSYCDDMTDVLPSPEEVYGFLHGAKICFAIPKYPELMKKLRNEGTTVIYDFGWKDNMRISDYEEILSCSDIYSPNDKEAMQLTGTSSPEEAIKCLSKYVKCPIVKIGKEGCLTIKDGRIIHVGMPCSFNAIDTTGAGDNFLAGVVYGLCMDWEIADCMKMGNIFGGISTTCLGCYRGIMYKTETDLSNYMKMY